MRECRKWTRTIVRPYFGSWGLGEKRGLYDFRHPRVSTLGYLPWGPVVADQVAGDGSPVEGGGTSVAGEDGSSAAGGTGSFAVGGDTSAADGGVVDSPSAAGDGASVGGDAFGAGGGGGNGVSTVSIALGADGSRDCSRDGSRADWSGDPFAVGEDSSGMVS